MFHLDFLKKVPTEATFTAHHSQKFRPYEVQVMQQKLEQHEEEKMFHLFDIADRYAFDNITKHLVAIIDANQLHFDPVRKMLIGSKHDDLRHWVKPAFDEIVKRSNGLTLEEMRNLGFERVSEICTTRERFYKEYNFDPSQPTLSEAFYHA